jgi:hypothetical protein
MSRILRRPMFRGGRVDSRGTGITSGLMDGGRVGYQNGNIVLGGDLLKKNQPDLSTLAKTRFSAGMPFAYELPAINNQNIEEVGKVEDVETDDRGVLQKFYDMLNPSKETIEDRLKKQQENMTTFDEKMENIGIITNKQKQKIIEEAAAKSAVGGREDPDIENARIQQENYEKNISKNTGTGTGENTEEPVVDAQSMIKENAELFRELFAESNKEKLKKARIADISDIGLSIFAKSQRPGATVGTMLADAAEEIISKPSRVEKQRELIDKQGDTAVALAINDYIAGKRSDESIKKLIAGKDLDLARAIKLADYKDKKNSFIDNLKENAKGMNFSTALITSVQETFKKVPTILTEKDVKKGVKVDAVEENVGEYFVYPSGKVTTVQDVGDGTYQEVVVYTRGG